jgi:hypothetical protein
MTFTSGVTTLVVYFELIMSLRIFDKKFEKAMSWLLFRDGVPYWHEA